MSYADLFHSVKSELLELNALPKVFKHAKKLRSFSIMLNSIQNAMRDQITQQLGVDPDHIDRDYADAFDRKARSLKFNFEVIFKMLGKICHLSAESKPKSTSFGPTKSAKLKR